jgi:hypothetical protein
MFPKYKKYTTLTQQEREEIYKNCIDGLYVTRVLIDELAKNGHKATRSLAIMYVADNQESPTYNNTKNWFVEVCDFVCKCNSPFTIHDYLKRTEKAIKARLAVMKYD